VIPKSRYVTYFLLAIVGSIADLWTKQAIFAWRGSPGEQAIWWIVPNYVGIETAVNTGALFGLGSGYGWLFAVMSIAAGIGVLVWLFGFRAAQSLWLTVAMGCVTGGIIGNLYDRLGFGYHPDWPVAWKSGVRDWILLRWGSYTWPNFNIADSLLVCGAIMLAWHTFRTPPEPDDAQQQSSSKS
jgi:signal peptidase II